MTERMGYSGNDLCKSCLHKEEEGSLQHYHVIGPSYMETSKMFWQAQFSYFRVPECSSVDESQSTGWFQKQQV